MAFIQLVKAPWRILKDFIQIMKMELVKLCLCTVDLRHILADDGTVNWHRDDDIVMMTVMMMVMMTVMMIINIIIIVINY